MFGNLAHIIPTTPSSQSDGPPKEVPPPTPIHFPQCRPESAAGSSGPQPVDSAETTDSDIVSGRAATAPPTTTQTHTHLTTLLQSLVRPADQVQVSHLEALGVCVYPDASLADVIPKPSSSDDDENWSLPPFDHWDTLSREETLDYVRSAPDSRPKLCNGKPVPGPTKYVDLRQGLMTENERAFRAVRRVTPRPGEQYVRLGYCHDFFRNLEALTSFWDDTSIEPSEEDPKEGNDEESKSTPQGGSDGTTEKPSNTADNTNTNTSATATAPFYRTSTGSAMPAPFRTQLLNSFLKLVTYDFNCNIMSRSEPRLFLKSPTSPTSTTSSTTTTHKRTQFTSGCSFIYRMPLDRDSAKRGIIEGPLAAVSPRHTTSFPPLARERESVIDLSREVIAALITAQQRAREGKKEVRLGKDAWWTTRRRWGGGSGGPIGKEAELLEAREMGAGGSGGNNMLVVGDKDERPAKDGLVVEGDGTSSPSPSSSSSSRSSMRPPPMSGISRSRFTRPIPSSFSSSSSSSSSRLSSSGGGSTSGGTPPPSKRARTSLAIYDAYRMVRPPSSQWDPKTRYSAIGRQRGVDYDDVFVISSLFHHVAILRVRVPDRLLAILDGGGGGDCSSDTDTKSKGWDGKLELYRTKWFDFFVQEDRVEAMKTVWAVIAYAMREVPSRRGGEDGDVAKKKEGDDDIQQGMTAGVAGQQGQKMDIDS